MDGLSIRRLLIAHDARAPQRRGLFASGRQRRSRLVATTAAFGEESSLPSVRRIVGTALGEGVEWGQCQRAFENAIGAPQTAIEGNA